MINRWVDIIANNNNKIHMYICINTRRPNSQDDNNVIMYLIIVDTTDTRAIK